MVWKIGCNSDSFRETARSFEYMLKVLSELGFDSVEPQVITGQASSILYGYDPTISLESDPIEIKRLAADYGLEIICISAHANLMDVGEAGPCYLMKAIRFAKLIGAEIVNTSEGPKPDYLTEEEAFQLMKFNLRSILRLAKNLDIKVSIEPHNIYTVQTATMLRILNLAPPELSEYLGVNFDTGNVTLFGTDPLEMLDAVIDRVIHVHLKDLDRETYEKYKGKTGIPFGTALGKGIVPLKEIIDRLKKAGFDGELSIECSATDLKESIEYV
ncbi:MAG: hypothetical protein DRN64_00770, partial [Thaumarchaeota archaeon]